MASAEERAVRKLKKQIAKTQRRLTKTQGQKRRRGGLLGGVVLGTVAGGVLTYYLSQRSSDDEWAQGNADDAILLREQPTPTGQSAQVKPPPKPNVAESKGNPTDELAVTPPKSPTTAEERAAPPEDSARPAPLAQPAQAQAEQPQQAAAPAPTEQPAARTEQPAKPEQPDKAEQPAKAQSAPQQAAPLPVEIERPEILLAKASGNTDEELAEATSNEPTPATTEMRTEPVDGVCPASHPIKGNRGSMGAMIYHVPGGRNYERTKPEACFATIEEAEAAGYRAPRG